MRPMRLRAAVDRGRGGTARHPAVRDGHDLERLVRWSGQLAGRGACKHPDGAAGLLHSGLRVFADEFDHHERAGRCNQPERRGRAA